jgi:hypothetical protein
MKGKKTTAKTPRTPRKTGTGSRGDAEAQPGPRRGKTYQPRATPWETNAPRGEWQP